MAKNLSTLTVGDTLELLVLASCQAQFGGTIIFRIADGSHPGNIPGNVTLVGDQALQVLNSPYCSGDIYPLYNLPEDTLVSDVPNANGNYQLTSEPVVIPVESISIDQPEMTEIPVNETFQLSVTFIPSNATDKTVTWSSSDTGILSVDADGVLTAKNIGTAIVTATTINGKTASITLGVIAEAPFIPVESIKIDQAAITTIRKGKPLQCAALITPENATDKTVTWASSNPASVTVSATGLLTGIKAGGSARITATASNGLSYTITVSVDS